MRNACVVFMNTESSLSAFELSCVTDPFLLGGYSFSELRLISDKEEENFKNAVAQLKMTAENLAVVADKSKLIRLRDILSELFQGDYSQGTLSGASLFTQGDTSAFLLSADDSESGGEYVKNVCLPYLEKKYATRFDRLSIRAVGAEKSLIETLIAKAERMSGDKLRYNYTEKYGEDIIEILYDSSVPKMLADDVLRLFVDGLGDTVYTLDDTPLEKRLVQLLKLRGRKISVAESFTGGGVGRRIVSVSGASEVYFEGLNTYDELAKIKRLGVSEYTLNTLGAVSDQTAYEMAAGLLSTGTCDVAVATTGLAGPKSDRSELPVGLCYIAVGTREKVYVSRYRFDGDRKTITETAINYALFLAYRLLKNL